MADDKETGLAVAVGLVVAAAVAIQKTVEVAGPYIKPVFERVGDAIDGKITELKEKIELPEIPSSKSRTMLDDAKHWINSDRGLPVGCSVAKADISYKDCLEFEVVSMDHKPKQKVDPGTPIVLYYVTSEVVEKSKQLFIESEEQKAEAERLKIEARAEKTERRCVRGEQNKQKIDDIVATIQQGVVGMTDSAKSKIEKLVMPLNKNKELDIQIDNTKDA